MSAAEPLAEKAQGGEFEGSYSLAGGKLRSFAARDYEYIYDLESRLRPQETAMAALEISGILRPRLEIESRLKEARSGQAVSLDALNHDILMHEIAASDLRFAEEVYKRLADRENGLTWLDQQVAPYIRAEGRMADNHSDDSRKSLITPLQAVERLYTKGAIGNPIRVTASYLIKVLLAAEKSIL